MAIDLVVSRDAGEPLPNPPRECAKRPKESPQDETRRIRTMAAQGLVVLQSLDPTGGGPLALIVTLLVATAFYAITLHLAAVFFVGEVATQRAVMAAPVPAVTSILLQQWGPEVVIPVTLLGDFLAIRYSYKLPITSSVALTALHFAFSVALIIPLNNIFEFV